MQSTNPESRILQAVTALKAYDRDAAVRLLREELRHGASTGERWRSVATLAGQIGEIGMALEAMRRFAATQPVTLDRKLAYWGELAGYDRTDLALREVRGLPPQVRDHPAVLHFLGITAGAAGDFDQAASYYRKAIAQSPLVPQTWFALAMIKTFAPGDPDLASMERIAPQIRGADPSLRARLLYGLAKAYHDCGDYERAWRGYADGAALRRMEERWDPAGMEAFAVDLIRNFTRDAMAQLQPVRANPRKALFINGLPRSGTTLVEQILVSHSQVENGSEVNLLRAALIPAGRHTFADALAYQQRSTSDDPWGDLAASYFAMLEARFHTTRLVVDKTLTQSHFMGLLLHMLPDARVIWMRRNPEDVALSCFRNFFTSKIPWSWSMEDIGRFFAMEDRLFEHWTAQFPDRILVVPYEEMVREPAQWVDRILDHAGLQSETQVMDFHKTRRSVKTASVSQVREPISTKRIGLSQAYDRHLEPFRQAYRHN